MQNSKRQKTIMEKIEELKAYPLSEAISLIQSFPKLIHLILGQLIIQKTLYLYETKLYFHMQK